VSDVNDPSGYRDKYKQTRERLETADIDQQDRKAIRALIDRRDASGDYEPSTQENFLTMLIRCAELAHKPLHQFEQDEFNSDYAQFLKGLQEGTIEGVKEGGYSDEYVRSFRQSLRLLFKHLGRDWYEDIHVGQPSPGKIAEDDCFSSDETAKMFMHAGERDSAILAVMLATGQRISALASIRLQDLELRGNRGGFYLNPEAVGLKGAEGYRPLIWATPYVNRWLNKHPHWPDYDDDDALFVTLRSGPHYDYGDPLGYSGFEKTLSRLVEAAGISQDKAQTHRLRHTAIRRMIRDGLSDQRIKYMVGWHSDSQHLDRYGALKDKSHAQDIEDHYGMAPEEEDEEVGHLFENCPACGVTISEMSGVQFCHSCGVPLQHSAEYMDAMAEQALWDSKGITEDDEGVDTVKEVFDDPSSKADVMAEMKEELLEELREEIE
jgi:integrase